MLFAFFYLAQQIDSTAYGLHLLDDGVAATGRFALFVFLLHQLAALRPVNDVGQYLAKGVALVVAVLVLHKV